MSDATPVRDRSGSNDDIADAQSMPAPAHDEKMPEQGMGSGLTFVHFCSKMYECQT